MTAIHATLIASAIVNILALFGWWNTIDALRDTERYVDNLRHQRDSAQYRHLEALRVMHRLRLEWPRRDPVTGRYTKKG